jgi:hypothetical protein
MSEKPRPPSEVSAALRVLAGLFASSAADAVKINEAANLIDQQAADLAQARRERDDLLGAIKVCGLKTQYAGHADVTYICDEHGKPLQDILSEAERQLSEAREALASERGRGEGGRSRGAAGRQGRHMTPEQKAAKIMQNVCVIGAFDGARRNEFTSTFTVTNERYKTRAELHAEISAAIREAERLALERAAKVASDKWGSMDDDDYNLGYADACAEIARAIRALSQPEAPAAPSTDEEVRAWCERVYRETGVTPALRAAYEFYKANYRGETPAEKTEGT